MPAAAAAVADTYNEEVVRKFTIATIFWGVVAFAAGVFIALQLAFPELNLGLPWTTFGRLRPVHTSAAIFAFGGNALFATSLFVVQRTCRAPLFGLVLFAFATLFDFGLIRRAYDAREHAADAAAADKQVRAAA